MTGRIITCEHVVYELPALLEWNIVCTGAVPCDSFSAVCVYTPDMAEALHLAVSFLALDGEKLLLHGIVDEYEIDQSGNGRTVTLTGRGYACRLLDNESRPVTYQAATLGEIVRNHVTPYGISCAVCDDLRATGVYTVAAGQSQWKALENFCHVYGGFSPRFTAGGELIASAENGGKAARLLVGDETSLLRLSKRENHYGVLSEMLVIDKTRGTSYTVKNEPFLRRGGQCRRVLYTPGQSTWAAMRYTGEYQIAQSGKDEVQITICLPGVTLAEPGAAVELRRGDCGLNGTYRVAEAEYACSAAGGETTTLTLKEEKEHVAVR